MVRKKSKNSIQKKKLGNLSDALDAQRPCIFTMRAHTHNNNNNNNNN